MRPSTILLRAAELIADGSESYGCCAISTAIERMNSENGCFLVWSRGECHDLYEEAVRYLELFKPEIEEIGAIDEDDYQEALDEGGYFGNGRWIPHATDHRLTALCYAAQVAKGERR